MGFKFKRLCYWVITVLVISFIAGGSYYYLNNIYEYKYDKLGSIKSNNGSLKINEDEKYRGILTYGPYIDLSRGNYIVEINYKTNTDLNEFDIVYSKNDEIHTIKKGLLKADSNNILIEIDLDERISNLEIRTKYNGVGNFEVKSIRIKATNFRNEVTYLQILGVLMISITFTLGWLYFTLEKVYSKLYGKLFGHYGSKEIKRIFIFLIVISILACIPYLEKGLASSHDIRFHLNRIEGIKDGILAGQFPVKIYPNIKGYGYANGIFYPDLFMYIPALLRLIGFGMVASYKIFIFVCTLCTAGVMFYAIYKMVGCKRVASLASILYVFAPYRLTNVFTRAAIGEVLVFIFLPLTIWGLYELIWGDERKYWPLVIGVVGVMNSHIISIVLLGIMLILLTITQTKKIIWNKSRLGAFIKAGVWCLVLSSYIWMPILEQLFTSEFVVSHSNNRYILSELAVQVPTLFNTNITSGKFTPYLGIHLLLLPIIMCYRKKDSSDINRFGINCIIVGAILVIMATKLFPWDIFQPILGNIQFPWRFYMVATCALIMGGSILLRDILGDKNSDIYIYILLVIAVIIGNPIIRTNIEANKSVSAVATTEIGAGEYLPYMTDKSQLTVKNARLISNNDVMFENYNKKGTNIALQFYGNEKLNTYIDVPLLYYKGYVAKLRDSQDNVSMLKIEESKNNLVRININDISEGFIEVYYKGTTIQHIAFILPFIALIVIFIYKKDDNRKKVN